MNTHQININELDHKGRNRYSDNTKKIVENIRNNKYSEKELSKLCTYKEEKEVIHKSWEVTNNDTTSTFHDISHYVKQEIALHGSDKHLDILIQNSNNLSNIDVLTNILSRTRDKDLDYFIENDILVDKVILFTRKKDIKKIISLDIIPVKYLESLLSVCSKDEIKIILEKLSLDDLKKNLKYSNPNFTNYEVDEIKDVDIQNFITKEYDFSHKKSDDSIILNRKLSAESFQIIYKKNKINMLTIKLGIENNKENFKKIEEYYDKIDFILTNLSYQNGKLSKIKDNFLFKILGIESEEEIRIKRMREQTLSFLEI